MPRRPVGWYHGRMEHARLAPVTYHELRRFPDDRKRRELIEGELFVSPAPSPTHQDIVANVLVLVRGFAHQHGLGEVWPAPLDVILSSIDVVQPDVVFLSNECRHLLTRRGIEGAPDLCVEVISRGTASTDRITKRALYARYGVLEYWILDPRSRRIELLGLTRPPSERSRVHRVYAPLDASAVLPGFAMAPDQVFRLAYQWERS
jgi:Uma2 family endonuclease